MDILEFFLCGLTAFSNLYNVTGLAYLYYLREDVPNWLETSRNLLFKISQFLRVFIFASAHGGSLGTRLGPLYSLC